ncbi:MAG: glutaredoxin family protein [Anaerolineaceae bacterium]
MRFRKAVILISAIVLIICAAFILFPTDFGSANPMTEDIQSAVMNPDESNPVVIYLFWGDGCPHCAVAKPFLNSLAEKYPSVEIRDYEVWYVEVNQELMTKMTAAYGTEPRAVPTIFIGEKYWEGFNDVIQQEIQRQIEKCLVDGCPDKGIGIIPGLEGAPSVVANSTLIADNSEKITLPLIGSVDLSAKSVWVSTILISLVDGVNPCSIWVLTMLLAITLHAGSRKKVVIIGLVFLTVTAAIYALFIAGLFTMLTVINFVGWIQVVVAVVSLFFSIINIKDYFWYKEGLSLTISDDKKPGIFQRMRRVVDASQSFWGLVGATVVLAAGVSLVEFSCTAGFPVLWTNILVSQNVTGWTFILLLLLYLVIYQLDEMVIFFTAVYSLKASKLEEKHGRLLKLIGGMLMLTLALVMIINPALMNSLSSSLWIFGTAFAGTLLILFLHRYLLPRLGIKIGSEFEQSSQRKNRKRKNLS